MSELVTPAKGIYHPNKGYMPAGWREALQVVTDYDDSLTLGRREDGEWLVCRKRADGPPFPVLGLGRSPEPPSREVIQRKLYQGDVRRNGERIVASLERAQAREQARARKAASEAAGEWAEYAEFATRGRR